MEKLLIIGGVAAGATAAARARRLNSDIEITMLEAGPDVSFANCGLPYYIGGDIKSRSKLILQSPESFKEQYNVNVITMTEAVSIDREKKIVSTINHENGEKRDFPYDKLILSQGGKPFIPGLKGAENDNVFSLWTLDDMDEIDNYIKDAEPKTAVVIGGGFIGLEMVEALAKRGLKTSVVEMAPHVMPLLENEMAGYLQQELISYGVGVYTGRSVNEINDGFVTLDNGGTIKADMVIMSVGVRPTLKLARDSGLIIGEMGGLAVDEYLQTSDPAIFAGGDMAEINHSVLNKKIRIPLAGPANRQGRIAATNALASSDAERKVYKGAQGTSIVRVFDAVAGTTGLNLKQARDAGFDAESIVIHKDNHVTYYPGSEMVSIHLIYDKASGNILGAQTAGYAGADKRLDVLSTAIASGMSLDDLGELDLSYAPPFGSANDPVNMAAFAAQNKLSGYSPSLTAEELEDYIKEKELVLIDLRDYFSFQKARVEQASNLDASKVMDAIESVPGDIAIIVYDETGKVAHRVARQLLLAGFSDVHYISGGFISLERYAFMGGFKFLNVKLPEIEKKSINDKDAEIEDDKSESSYDGINSEGPLVVDVRTPMEFQGGAYPGAINIPLDELQMKIDELGSKDRDLTLYCASGARSAYGVRVLQQAGFTHVKNGGGIMQMMS